MWVRPCVDYPSGLTAFRLRLRRMLCYLRTHGLVAVAHDLERATGVFFDAHYMKRLLKMGRWVEADGYLQHFFPTPTDWSDECTRLMVHLHHALTLAAVAAGGSEARDYATRFDDEDVSRTPFYARFQKVLHKMHADQPRASMLWKKIAPNAVNTTMRLVANCPELKSKMQKLPRNRPWEVIPLIGARGSQRRRKSSKVGGRTTAHALSRAFLLQRKRLHSTQGIAYSAACDEACGGKALENQDKPQL